MTTHLTCCDSVWIGHAGDVCWLCGGETKIPQRAPDITCPPVSWSECEIWQLTRCWAGIPLYSDGYATCMSPVSASDTLGLCPTHLARLIADTAEPSAISTTLPLS